jgi:gliding motility-associated-like protein
LFRKLRLLIFLLLAAVYSGYAQVPVATIFASPKVGCPPLAVSFTDGSTNSPTSRVWSFPGGSPSSSNSATIGVSYATPGMYVATLVSTNASGSSAPDTVHIYVDPVPVANFTKNNPPVACYPTHVQFTNTSVPNSGAGETFTSYLWNFGDGQQSTVANPDHRYTSGGNFKVELYITNNFGCTGNSQTVVVDSAVVLNGGIFPNFTPTLNSSCTLPVTATFTNTTTTTGGIPAPTWNWDFGDGAGFNNIMFSPQYSYTTANTYTVRLAATSSAGCSDTFAVKLPITASGNLTNFTSPDTVCLNSTVTFTNSSSPPPSSSTWDYGDGSPMGTQTNETHVYTTTGIKHVVLTNTYVGCQGTQAKDILVVNPPVTSFTGTNLSGCRPPLTANFSGTSTGASIWFWDFGDGTTSNQQNPSHTYTKYGNFPVTLTSTAAAGCSTSLQDTSFVKVDSPTVSINNLPAFGCAPYLFTATATALTVDGVATYSWDLGNGVMSSSANPPTQVYAAGTYIIKLTITTTGGCTASATGTVQVGTTKPVAAFSYLPASPVCVATPVNFTSTTPLANKWFWEFGDGSVDNTNTSTPMYSYPKPGTYSVRLTAYDNGCWDTISHSIVVSGPLAGFKYSEAACQNNNFTFTDTSTGGPITSWIWNFGDGSMNYSGQFPPAHAFPTGPPKTYTVTLTASNGICTNSATQSVTANQVLGITPQMSEICTNTIIQLSKTPSGGPYYNKFEYGDGTYSNWTTAESIGKSWSSPGSYIVKMIDSNTVTGCIDSSAGTTITVDGPTAKFTPPPALSCKALTYNFVDMSTPSSPADPIVTWNWNFGDGTSSPQTDVSHTYNFAGNFSPSLIVTDKRGCMDTFAVATPTTVSLPVASFKMSEDSSCPNAPNPIRFINTSTGGFNPAYTWTFGDGGTSNQVSPFWTYTNVGNYTVTLAMKDMYGCISDSVLATPIIVDTPHADFTMTGNYSACPPFNDAFTFTGSFADGFDWNFTDGNGSVSENPSNLFSNPGDYYPSLVVTSPGGCQSPAVSQHVRVDGPVATFVYSPYTGCDSLEVNFKVTTSNSVSFVWNFGDNTPLIYDTIPTKTHLYNKPGPSTPIVTLQDAQGCKINQFGTTPIEIDSIGKTSFTIDRTTVCDSGIVNFTSNSVVFPDTAITSYTWNFGDGTPPQTGMFPTTSHDYTVLGSYTATLSITTFGGCSGTFTLPAPITVAGTPKISITGLINQCEPATLNLAGIETVPDPNPPVTWTWNFGNGQTATGATQNNVSFPKAGEYVVYATATNSAGCSAMTDTAGAATHLFIYPTPTVNAGPDATICDTSSLQINATGTATSYTWQVPTIGNLTCLNCANPVATAPSSTYFVVTGTTLFGCTAIDTLNLTVNTQVTVTASGNDSVCLGQSVPLTATGAAIYTWSPTEGLSNPAIANPLATPDVSQIGSGSSNVITYTVTGYDDKLCYSDTKSVTVTAFKYPVISMPNNTTINVGSSYQITSTVSTNIVSLNWTPANNLSCNNCLSPLASPMTSTTYSLEATNDGGCTATDSIHIQVICNGVNFFVPNSFSPNGDGVNDYFIVNGTGLNVIPSLTIYNRWGQIVFQKSNFAPNSASQAWDGTFNGQPAPSDVYVYTLQILCNNATLISYHGDVTLIR